MEIMFEGASHGTDSGRVFERVNMNVLDTGTLNPRTNKRKVRKYLVTVVGIAPAMVKRAMLELDMVGVPRKNLSVMREWIKRHAPEVDVRDVNKAARMVKASPSHPIGILDGKLRRATQLEHDLEKARREADAIDKALGKEGALRAALIRMGERYDETDDA